MLGLLFKEPSKNVPEMKTAIQQGFDLSIGTNRGFLLPKKTPKPVVDYYIKLVKAVAEDPAFKRQIEEKGSFVVYLGGQDYANWWKQEFEAWKSDAIAVGLYRPQKKKKS